MSLYRYKIYGFYEMCDVKYEIQHVCYTYTPLQYISEKSLDLMSLRDSYRICKLDNSL